MNDVGQRRALRNRSPCGALRPPPDSAPQCVILASATLFAVLGNPNPEVRNQIPELESRMFKPVNGNRAIITIIRLTYVYIYIYIY